MEDDDVTGNVTGSAEQSPTYEVPQYSRYNHITTIDILTFRMRMVHSLMMMKRYNIWNLQKMVEGILRVPQQDHLTR